MADETPDTWEKAKPLPIFDLIRIVESDETARELSRFAQYTGINSIRDLVLYSRERLQDLGMTSTTLDAIEPVLKDRYQLAFPVHKETQLPEPAVEINRNYLIEDHGSYLVVNGVEIRLSTKSMPIGKVKTMYEMFKAGREKVDIINEVKCGMLTLDNYLRRANIIPPAKPHDRSYSGKSHVNASGAPPQSAFARIREQYRRP